MKLYIPKLGDELKLTSDWTFKLESEYRNSGLYDELYGERNRQRGYRDHETKDTTLPKDTVLKVDRIYIRQGSEDYDSVTFRISYCPNTKLNKKRFWVKLNDANNIEFESTVVDKKIKMQWRNWIRNIRTNLTLKNTFDNVYDFKNEALTLVIDTFTRFEIKLIVDKLEPTNENWLKAGLNKIYMGHSKEYPAGEYPTLDDYMKHYASRYSGWSKPKLEDYVILVVNYQLTDFKTGQTFIYATVNSCKEKARSILKEEAKNGK